METRTPCFASVPGPALKRGFQRKARPLFGARSFLRGRTSPGARRGSGWSKVSLQWRRLAQRLSPASRAAPGGGFALHSWLTSVHLHLTTQPLSTAAATWRGTSLVPAGIATWAPPRNSSGTRLHAHAGGLRQPAHNLTFLASAKPPALPPARPAALAALSVPHVSAAGKRTLPSLPAKPRVPAAAPRTFWLRSPLSARSAPGGDMRIAVAPQAGKNNPMLFSATRSARNPAAPASGAAIWHRPTPELVWLKQPGAPAGNAPDPYTSDGHAGGPDDPGTDSVTPRQAVSAARVVQATPPAAAIAAQLRGGPLDAALADRLATEVIRRVERSMRIERERRGY